MSITSHISSLNFSPTGHQFLSHLFSSLGQSLSFWSSDLETSPSHAVDWLPFTGPSQVSHLGLPSARMALGVSDGVNHRCGGQTKDEPLRPGGYSVLERCVLPLSSCSGSWRGLGFMVPLLGLVASVPWRERCHGVTGGSDAMVSRVGAVPWHRGWPGNPAQGWAVVGPVGRDGTGADIASGWGDPEAGAGFELHVAVPAGQPC